MSACQATDLGRNLHPGRPDVNSAGIFMSCGEEALSCPAAGGNRQMDVVNQHLQTDHSQGAPDVICFCVCSQGTEGLMNISLIRAKTDREESSRSASFSLMLSLAYWLSDQKQSGQMFCENYTKQLL